MQGEPWDTKKNKRMLSPTQAPVIRKVDSAIHRWFVLLRLMHWIVIYPVYSIIQPLNNQGQSCFLMLKNIAECISRKKNHAQPKGEQKLSWPGKVQEK